MYLPCSLSPTPAYTSSVCCSSSSWSWLLHYSHTFSGQRRCKAVFFFFIHWFSPFFFFFKSFSLQSNMKNMEQELCCPVCDGMVKQPILLPCQHSVCLLCAAEVLLQRGYPPPDLPPEPQSPASTPNSRSPRQARRPTPRTPDRLERVLRTGVFVTLVKKTGRIFAGVQKKKKSL